MTAPCLKIRPFKKQEYDAVINLWKKVKLPIKPRGRDKRQNIEREISSPGHAIFLVAELNNKIIGTILGTHDGRKGWINRLAVHPEFQHQGVGSLLVHEVEEQLHKMGIEITACLIEDYNQTSMEFFQKIGYIKHKDILYLSKRKHPYT